MYKLTGKLAGLYLRWVAQKERATYSDSVQVQAKTLKQLVHTARNTRFGKDHQFTVIDSVEAYQNKVKLRSYTDFWQEYWQDTFPIHRNITWPGQMPYFAKSSGTTTGISKFIPCSREMVKSNNRAGLQVVIEHLRNKPESTMLEGRYFMFAGSPNLEQLAPDVFTGELSGIAAKETPSWAGRDRYYPPANLAKLIDWEEKLEKLSIDALNKDIRAISGLPTWLQILFERIFQEYPVSESTLTSYFPNLEMIVHGGMSFEPYYDYFQRITRNSDVDFREIYAASEGFFAISDSGYGEGMRLIVDNGIFYEFVRLDEFHQQNPRRYWLDDVDNDLDYVIVVTTCAGLWSFVIGDIIRFVDHKNLRLLFAGRVSQTLSVFGEKVINEELERAVTTAARSIKRTLRDFVVTSVFLQDKLTKGQHIYMVEVEERLSPDEEQRLSEEIDSHLISTNSGYATRRKNNISLVAPKIISADPGLFAHWMDMQGKSGGQHKVPRVINETQFTELSTLNRTLISKEG